jgi:hypothetical protein
MSYSIYLYLKQTGKDVTVTDYRYRHRWFKLKARKPKGQSRKDNPETLATYWARKVQNEDKQNTKT